MTYGGIDDAALTATITQVLDRWPSAGLAVAVIADGALAWFHGHGVADTAAKKPITQDTVFRIGSLTKTFTAVAVMQLREDGLLDLDAPANEYLRTFRLVPTKSNLRPATVRHLLTHTAGVGYFRRLPDLRNRAWVRVSARDGQEFSHLRTTTARACPWKSSREPPGSTATMDSPRSGRSSKT